MLLQADWVLPITGSPIPNGAIAVERGIIVAVGPAAELREQQGAEPVLEFPGCVLLPGFVNAHTHLDYSAFGGFAEPSGFGRWMLNLLLARRRLNVDDFAASALWGALACARSGITTIADASFEGWTVARAARAAGLRGRIYLEVFGLDDAGLPAAMERLEARLDRMRRECEPPCLVEPGISPHAPYTVSERFYREAARFARRAGLRLTTHLAESQAEVELLTGKKNVIARVYKAANMWTGQHWTPPLRRPVQYLVQAGVLTPEMLVVHAVQLDSADIAALAASGATVAHCPRSNARLRCGTAPVVELMAAGVTVGLGTDSLASNDDFDMFAEMRAALAASRARAATPSVAGGAPPAPGVAVPQAPEAAAPPVPGALMAGAVLRMATIDSARSLGWDHLVGSLEQGKRADIIAVALPAGRMAVSDGVTPRQPSEIVTALVETAVAADVRFTMVDGKVVFDRREQPRTPSDVLSRFQSVRRKLGLPTRGE